jgi:hypothetical protein
MCGRSPGFSLERWNSYIADVVSLRRLSAARWPVHMPCRSTGLLRNWAGRDCADYLSFRHLFERKRKRPVHYCFARSLCTGTRCDIRSRMSRRDIRGRFW